MYEKRAVLVLVATVLGLGFGGCRAPAGRGGGGTRGVAGPTREKQAAEHERAARLTTRPKQRASHYLDAAAVYLDLALWQEARRCLYDAREAYYAGEIAGRTNRMLGRTYLESGELPLAERYLVKGLEDAAGEERELTLARLVVAARAGGDGEVAERYERRLLKPHSPEVQRILEKNVRPAFPRRRSSALSDALARASRRRTAPQAPPRGDAHPEPRLSILPRWRWNARRSRGNVKPMSRIRKITVHHTGERQSVWGRSRQSVASELRRIQRYHQNELKWADIGYHFIIDRNGAIWQGRSLRYQGAHARNENPGNIGIALLGNYTRQRLTHEQRRSIADFIAMLARRYAIPPDRVYTHREIIAGKTDCPGPEISRYIAGIRWRLKSREAVAYRNGY